MFYYVLCFFNEYPIEDFTPTGVYSSHSKALEAIDSIDKHFNSGRKHIIESDTFDVYESEWSSASVFIMKFALDEQPMPLPFRL